MGGSVVHPQVSYPGAAGQGGPWTSAGEALAELALS
jgi:hypothetical protein